MFKLSIRRLSVLLILATILWMGCTTTQEVQKEKVAEPVKRGVFSLPAQVEKVEGDVITLRIEKPAPPKVEAKLSVALAQGAIDTCYLLEGKEILLDKTKVKVLRVSGNQAQVKLLEKILFVVGGRVTIPLEKKVIAIKDFEVIVGSSRDAAKFVQEDVTSLLVDSGQFSVVERAKVGTLLEEIQLGQTGAIDPATVQKAGKLLGAELILTGTLAASGEEWNVNLRLVNTETGLIMAAIHKLGPLHELTGDSMRAYDNIDSSFESGNPTESGWRVGRIVEGFTGVGGYQRVYLDTKEGANGTKQSLAMAFKLGSKRTPEFQGDWIRATMGNRIHRDLGRFKFIKFFVKGSDDFTFQLRMEIMSKKVSESQVFFTRFPITKEWSEVRIPFSTFEPGRGPQGQIKNVPFDLRNVQWIDWMTNEIITPKGTEGIVWLDEVSFY